MSYDELFWAIIDALEASGMDQTAAWYKAHRIIRYAEKVTDEG